MGSTLQPRAAKLFRRRRWLAWRMNNEAYPPYASLSGGNQAGVHTPSRPSVPFSRDVAPRGYVSLVWRYD